MTALRTAMTLASASCLLCSGLAQTKANWLRGILGKPRAKVEATLGKPTGQTADGVIYNYGGFKGILVSYHNTKGNSMRGIEFSLGTESDYRNALKKVGLSPTGVYAQKSTSSGDGTTFFLLDHVKGLPQYWGGIFVLKPNAPSRLEFDDDTK